MPNRANIMVIDDEEPVRALLKDFLTSQGYDVECYSSALTALRSLRTGSGPEVGVILSDVRMDPVNGFQFLETIKTEFPHVPVILFSGVGSQEESLLAKTKGAARYLSKPFSLPDLKNTIESAIKKRAKAG